MNTSTELPDGIYLDLSFDDYLALDRVSSSSLTDMMEGPSAYWARSAMNPDRELREETDAMKLGRAYHAARLEPDTFAETYVRELDAEDFADPTGETKLLTNGTQIGETLAALGEPKKKAGETVMMQARRLEDELEERDDTGRVVVWPLVRANWEAANQDKTWIGRKQWDEIKRDAARIRMNPELEAMISGGAAEVSILWTDEQTGLKCKCRPDYLGADFITHLKTWDMKSFGKPANQAIADTFRYNGHYRTGWFYLEGLGAMPGLKFRHATPDPSNEGNNKPAGRVMKKVPEPLAAAWQTPQPWRNWFMFVRRQGIPDIRAREVMYFDLPKGVEEQATGTDTKKFPRTLSVLGRKGAREVTMCLQQIAQCRELYGTKGEPWFPRDMIGKIEDADYSDWWLESMDEPR